MAAFSEIFEHVFLFSLNNDTDIALIGAHEPFRLNIKAMDSLFFNSGIRDDLQRVDIHNVIDLLTRFRIGPQEIKPLVRGVPINTDDNAWVEYHGYLGIQKIEERQLSEDLKDAWGGILKYLDLPQDLEMRETIQTRLSATFLQQED